jgi:hypothetical protein
MSVLRTSSDDAQVCWLDTAKPARYTEHDERNNVELERALIADRYRFAASPPEAAGEASV